MLEHLNAHLMMELSPSEQISAHNSTERTITTFASKLLPVPVEGSDGALFPGAGGVAVFVDW
jgi:hypothetical protein